MWTVYFVTRHQTQMKEARFKGKDQLHAAKTSCGFVSKAMLSSRFLGQGALLFWAAKMLFSSLNTENVRIFLNHQKREIFGFHSCVNSERHFTIFNTL